LKEEPAFCWELKKTGGSRWEKWAQREFFKVVTKKGKDFEELICEVAFSNRSSPKYLELKQKFFDDFGKNLDEYEMFGQVQLKYNDAGDYFIADQIFIKFDELESVEDMIVLENKQGIFNITRYIFNKKFSNYFFSNTTMVQNK